MEVDAMATSTKKVETPSTPVCRNINTFLGSEVRKKATDKKKFKYAIGSPLVGTLRIGSVQINSLNYDKLCEIIPLWKTEKYDYLAITDTRCTSKEVVQLKKLMRQLNPGDLYWFSGVTEQKMAGGFLILQSARLGKRCQHYEEGTNSGIYFSNTYRCGKEVITLATTYWPYDKREEVPDGVGTLRSRIKQHQLSIKSSVSPKDFVMAVCAKGAAKAEKLGHGFILMGDFNQPLEMAYSRGIEKGIEHWMSSSHLTHAGKLMGLPRINTFYKSMNTQEGGKELDHILVNVIISKILRGSYVGGNPQWNSGGLSDHLPLAIDIEEPMAGNRVRAKRREKKITYTTDLKPRFERINEIGEIVYDAKTERWREAVETKFPAFLEQLQKREKKHNNLEAVNEWIARMVFKQHRVGPDGYSPETAVLATYIKGLKNCNVSVTTHRSVRRSKNAQT